MSYRYKSQRRRRRRKWPWATVALAIMLLLIWWKWPFGQPTSIAGANGPHIIKPPQDGLPPMDLNASGGAITHAPATIAPGPPESDTPSEPAEPEPTIDTADEPAPKPLKIKPPPDVEVAIPDNSSPLVIESDTDLTAVRNRGMAQYRNRDYLAARDALSPLLQYEGSRLTLRDAQVIRNVISRINKKLIFSKDVEPDDSLVGTYLIKSGDFLSVIGPKYQIPWQLIADINKVDPKRLRPGRSLKVIRGPFHVVAYKADFRMDVFLKDPHGRNVHVCSFRIGVGKDDSTPEGNWVVRRGGKLTNPDWKNPRTMKYYPANDPKNPIGEYWIGLKGVDERTKDLESYGIHGTIDPSSIGRMSSMGCIRLLADDVELLFKLLVGTYSTVRIEK